MPPSICHKIGPQPTGKTNEQIENGFTPLQIPAAFAANFVVATVLSIVIDWANTGSAAGGALIGG